MPVFGKVRQRLVAIGAASGIVLALSVPLVSGTASAAAGVTTFDQCRNGAVGDPPALVACAGSGWSNGNLDGTNSHWTEGQFVPYRVAISGLGAGNHDLQITYRPGDSGAHAIDYLGSFDATETTSTTAATQNENHIDPCGDITMGAGWCTPGSPASSVGVTAPDFGGANTANCNTGGAFSGSQAAGTIDLFGPSGSAMTGFTYVAQDVSHGSGCDTTVGVAFTLPSDIGSNNIVIAWGGHVASAQDWGAGNSAGSISGSPYHMSLDSVDGTGTGSVDRSMNASVIYAPDTAPSDPGTPLANNPVTPTTTTILQDAVTGQPWSGDETTGATAYDTATVSGTDGPIPTGTVTYTFFTNGGCQGSGTTQTVAMVDGVPLDAATTAALGEGSYSFEAVYNGDDDYNPSAVSDCEPFTVQPAPTNVSNVVFSHQTGKAWSGTETAGGTADDTATLTGGVPGFVPTGTVTYLYFAGGCGGTPVWTDTVTLTGTGEIPASNFTDPLGAGTYSFAAAYGGDTNYDASGPSVCQSFVVTPITRVGPTDDPPGNAEGGGSTSASIPAAAAASATPTSPASPTSQAVQATPAGPVTLASALATTGADIAIMAAVALGLLGLGSILVIAGRRRRDTHGERASA